MYAEIFGVGLFKFKGYSPVIFIYPFPFGVPVRTGYLFIKMISEGINLWIFCRRQTVPPYGDKGTRFRYAVHLFPEIIKMEPMICLRNRNQVELVIRKICFFSRF